VFKNTSKHFPFTNRKLRVIASMNVYVINVFSYLLIDVTTCVQNILIQFKIKKISEFNSIDRNNT